MSKRIIEKVWNYGASIRWIEELKEVMRELHLTLEEQDRHNQCTEGLADQTAKQDQQTDGKSGFR